MKSEHRHELKTNDLAKSLMTFQDYVKVYGGRVALGFAIVILIIVLIVQRSGKSRAELAKSQDDLAYAANQINLLSHVQVSGNGQVTVHPAAVEQVRRLLQDIRDKASDKKVLAQATLLQGDYAWAMANYPEIPGADTQPSLRPDKDRGDLFKEAKDAYQQVLTQYSDQTLPTVAAHMGLAALAENEFNWDEAKRQYEAIKNMSDASSTCQNLAKGKLIRLEEIRQPILVGEVPDKEIPKPEVILPSTTTPTSTPSITTKLAATTESVVAPTTPKVPTATTRPATTRPAK
jgi:tetratricopeptide (TPR) repeat protein